MKLILTYTFKKKLLKIGSIKEEDIISLLKKYPNTNNLIILDNIESFKILKGYLYSKKIRILVLFEYIKGTFIPVSIIKKETIKGRNIMLNNYIKLFGNDIEKTYIDYNSNKYIEINI